MYRTGKFAAEVWQNSAETSLLKDGIVNYFRIKNQKIFFKYTNPFELIEIEPLTISRNFIAKFSDNIQSEDPNIVRSAYGVKYLSEELLVNPVKAPVCFHCINGKYILSKGAKKTAASSLIKMLIHPTIIVSETDIEDAYFIQNDYQLYDIMKLIDPTANTFYVRIAYDNAVPNFHFLCNQKLCYTWINEKECQQFYQSNRLNFPLKVVLLGLADTNDKNIDFIKLDKKIEDFSRIDLIHHEYKDKYSNYCCTIFSKNPLNVTTQYIEFVHVNLFLKSRTRFGYTHTLENFAKNDVIIKFNNEGIIHQIPNY